MMATIENDADRAIMTIGVEKSHSRSRRSEGVSFTGCIICSTVCCLMAPNEFPADLTLLFLVPWVGLDRSRQKLLGSEAVCIPSAESRC